MVGAEGAAAPPPGTRSLGDALRAALDKSGSPKTKKR
jgi:hypothetical protein